MEMEGKERLRVMETTGFDELIFSAQHACLSASDTRSCGSFFCDTVKHPFSATSLTGGRENLMAMLYYFFFFFSGQGKWCGCLNFSDTFKISFVFLFSQFQTYQWLKNEDILATFTCCFSPIYPFFLWSPMFLHLSSSIFFPCLDFLFFLDV